MNIQIRAWDHFHQYMVYSSEEGSTFKLENGKWSIQYIKEKNFYNVGIEMDAPVWHESDEIEVMLFTGLYDKQTEPIYEGDVLKSRYSDPYKIEFRNGNFCFCSGGYSMDFLSQVRCDNVKVIGNIFEHPHLLPQKQPA